MLNLSFANNNPPALNAQNMNSIVDAINTIGTQLASPFNFKGSVTYANLPPSGNTVNDTYYVTDRYCLYSWDGSDWGQSSLDESEYLSLISVLDKALSLEQDGRTKSITSSDLIQGTYEDSDGSVVSSNVVIRIDGLIPVYKGETIKFFRGETIRSISIGMYDTSKTHLRNVGWSNTKSFTLDFDGYVVIAFRKDGSTNITPSDYDADFYFMSNTANELNATSNYPIMFGNELSAEKITQRSETRLETGYIKVDAGDSVWFISGDKTNQIMVETYNDERSFSGQYFWTGSGVQTIHSTCFVRLVFRREGDANIDVSDYDAEVRIVHTNPSVISEIDELNSESQIIQITIDDIISGAYNRDGSVSENSHRIRLRNFIPISVGDIIKFKPGANAAGILLGFVNNYTSTLEAGWFFDEVQYTSKQSGFLMILFRKNPAGEIEPWDYDAQTIVIRKNIFESGQKRVNGYLFRCNYAEAIPVPGRYDTSYEVPYSDIIAKYDRIRSRVTTLYNDIADTVPKPVTITKSEILTTDSGYVLYKYTFTPAYPQKTILLQAGVHGNEYEGIYALYNLLTLMYTSFYNYPQLEKLKNDCKFVVIPVINPYGFEHNTKLNGDGINVYDYYGTDQDNPKEIQAVKEVANSEEFDYAMDIHTDPYTPAKGCYGYAYVEDDLYPIIYKQIMSFRDIVYNEFNFQSHYYNSDSKDIVVGRITSISSGGGSIGYFERLGIPANLIEIATGAESSGTPFATTGSAEMMRIATDWYTNVLLAIYNEFLS